MVRYIDIKKVNLQKPQYRFKLVCSTSKWKYLNYTKNIFGSKSKRIWKNRNWDKSYSYSGGKLIGFFFGFYTPSLELYDFPKACVLLGETEDFKERDLTLLQKKIIHILEVDISKLNFEIYRIYSFFKLMEERNTNSVLEGRNRKCIKKTVGMVRKNFEKFRDEKIKRLVFIWNHLKLNYSMDLMATDERKAYNHILEEVNQLKAEVMEMIYFLETGRMIYLGGLEVGEGGWEVKNLRYKF